MKFIKSMTEFGQLYHISLAAIIGAVVTRKKLCADTYINSIKEAAHINRFTAVGCHICSVISSHANKKKN